MPTYEAVSLDGTKFTEFFCTMSRAPKVGEMINIDGIDYKRVLSVPTLATLAIATSAHGYPYVSHSMPQLPPEMAKSTSDGFAIVRSEQHERELCKATGRVRERISK